MMEFVAAPVRQRETVVALADASEFGRQVQRSPAAARKGPAPLHHARRRAAVPD
jgi:hypothetical protein